jgi:pilus assembly protein CpaF
MELQVLIASEGNVERRKVQAPNGVITIGRATDCMVALQGHRVSRHHVTIDLNGKTMRVRDSSRNGTLAGAVFISNGTADVPLGVPLVVGEFTVSLTSPGDGSLPLSLSRAGHARPALATEAAQALEHIRRTTPPPAPPIVPIEITPERGTPALQPVAPVAAPAPAPAEATPAPAVDLGAQRAQEMADELRRRDAVALRREIHRKLLEHLDLATVEPSQLDDPSLRPKVLNALRRIIAGMGERIPPEVNRDALVGELVDEALGLGPLENFLTDPTVNEIMVVDPDTIYIEQRGKLRLAEARFTDDERVRAVIERIVTPLGRRIDESSPIVDARLRDGSRVNAVIRPLALRGSTITIRKFSRSPLNLEKLVQFGAMTESMGTFLTRAVTAKKNIVIAGGTGSGKTTLLNVLSGAIPPDERIVTIEDAAELQLGQPHVISLETRPANMEGKGEYTIRDLVKNALRMRPDRIVVGECRGGEALDMLQAMNTGHDGSLTTTHANSPREAVARLETLCLMAGIELPIRAIREQIAGSVHLLVQQTRLSDGSRKVTAISEVTGVGDEGEIEIVPIFQFVRTGTSKEGKVVGEHRATGFLPSFLNDFLVLGLVKPGEGYL